MVAGVADNVRSLEEIAGLVSRRRERWRPIKTLSLRIAATIVDGPSAQRVISRSLLRPRPHSRSWLTARAGIGYQWAPIGGLPPDGVASAARVLEALEDQPTVQQLPEDPPHLDLLSIEGEREHDGEKPSLQRWGPIGL
jgi:hypothetical protein